MEIALHLPHAPDQHREHWDATLSAGQALAFFEDSGFSDGLLDAESPKPCKNNLADFTERPPPSVSQLLHQANPPAVPMSHVLRLGELPSIPDDDIQLLNRINSPGLFQVSPTPRLEQDDSFLPVFQPSSSGAHTQNPTTPVPSYPPAAIPNLADFINPALCAHPADEAALNPKNPFPPVPMQIIPPASAAAPYVKPYASQLSVSPSVCSTPSPSPPPQLSSALCGAGWQAAKQACARRERSGSGRHTVAVGVMDVAACRMPRARAQKGREARQRGRKTEEEEEVWKSAEGDEAMKAKRAAVRARLRKTHEIPGPARYARGADPQTRKKRRASQNRLSAKVSRDIRKETLMELEREAQELENREKKLLKDQQCIASIIVTLRGESIAKMVREGCTTAASAG